MDVIAHAVLDVQGTVRAAVQHQPVLTYALVLALLSVPAPVSLPVQTPALIAVEELVQEVHVLVAAPISTVLPHAIHNADHVVGHAPPQGVQRTVLHGDVLVLGVWETVMRSVLFVHSYALEDAILLGAPTGAIQDVIYTVVVVLAAVALVELPVIICALLVVSRALAVVPVLHVGVVAALFVWVHVVV